MSNAECDAKFLDLLSKNPQGLPQAKLNETGFPIEDVLRSINKFVREGRVIYFQTPEQTQIYKEVLNPDDHAKYKGLTKDDLLVYQMVEQSGNKGTWTKDIKNITNLQQVQITKILKLLESRRLIKAVKTIDGGRKKVYMAYNVEPSRDVTGGTLYGGEQHLEPELIAAMKLSLHSFISNKGAADINEVMNFMKKQGEQDMTQEDVQMLVSSLIYDGMLEEMRDTRVTTVLARRTGIIYKPTKTKIPENNLCKMPCGNCPVAKLCGDEGVITPRTCVYFTQWLASHTMDEYY